MGAKWVSEREQNLSGNLGDVTQTLKTSTLKTADYRACSNFSSHACSNEGGVI